MTEEPIASESFLRKWGQLLVLSLALAIVIIDTTLLNVSLATLIRELHTTLQNLQWVISAYSLTLAALTVTGGRLGDLFGRKRMFNLGAAIFAAGSLIASISRNIPTLIAGESIIEGIGAAMMMPATASLLITKYRGHDRAIAFGIWGGVAAAASAIGPILGGFLTTHFTWRWGFRINVVVVAILLAGSVIIEDSGERRGKRIDFVGVALSAIGLFFVVFGIIESTTYGWIHALKPFPLWQPGPISITPVAWAIGFVILAMFGIWEYRLEQRGGTPIVSMRIFQNAAFVSGATITGLLMLAQNGVIFSMPVFLQAVKQLDAFHTGLTLLPMSLALLLVSPLAATLTKRIPHKRLVQSGIVINIVAILVLRFVLAADMSLSLLIPGLALYGAGMGLVLSQINNLTLSSVPVREAGEASGVTNTFRQIGSSLGAAIIGAILLSSILSTLEADVAQSPRIPPQSKAPIANMLRAESSSLAFGGAEVFARVEPATRSEMVQLRRTATTAGNRSALLYGAVFLVIALLVSTKLPLRPNEESH
jgi:EmrB/QacA subfamily drug resistance transporter